MRNFKKLILASTALAFCGTTAHALEGVVVSIKPVHSLVAGVMKGIGEPELLVRGAGSPHTYSMRPSEAAMLENASVVFWVGPDLEMFLARPLETLASDAKIVKLSEAHDLVRLGFREGGPFEAHAHDDDDHAHEDGHAHGEDDHSHDDDAHDDHAHDDHAHDEHAHDDHDDHGHDDHADHGDTDMHLWLDPENAKAFVHEIEEALAEADPDNADAYRTNAEALMSRLDDLIAETQAAVEPVADRGFIVFHDAYQYFENRFGVAASGSVTVSPEVMPGAHRISEIRERVQVLGATCVFAEPQFEPRLVEVVTEGTEARAGVLDPLGADLEDGPELYFQLIGNLTTSLTTCLGGES